MGRWLFDARLVTRLLLTGACAGGGWLAGTTWRVRTGVRIEAVPPVDEQRFPAAGMIVGPAGAPTLRIFVDYECGACRELDRRYGDTLFALAKSGRIRLVYHQSPLRTHTAGALAGAAAYCAVAHGGGWRVHRELYRSSTEWSEAGRSGAFSPIPGLLQSAAAAGADSAAVRACMGAGRAGAAIREDRALARLLNVHAVPAVFTDSARLEFRTFRALLGHIARLAS